MQTASTDSRIWSSISGKSWETEVFEKVHSVVTMQQTHLGLGAPKIPHTRWYERGRGISQTYRTTILQVQNSGKMTCEAKSGRKKREENNWMRYLAIFSNLLCFYPDVDKASLEQSYQRVANK